MRAQSVLIRFMCTPNRERRVERLTLAQPIRASEASLPALVDAGWTRFGSPHAPQYSVGPRGVRSTPSGASEDRGVSQTFTTTITAGETRTVARSVVPTPRVDSIWQPLPRAHSAGLRVGQPSAPRDVSDVAPAAIVDNLTRLLASREPDPKVRAFDAFDTHVTVDDGSR